MSESNPWTTLGSRMVYENPWIRVREDRVLRPGGEPGIYGVVESAVATAVVALTEADEVIFVGQYRYTMGCYSWEVVEGAARNDETPLEGAQRELREETGLVAEHWEPLGGEIHLSNCFTSERGRCFLARGLTEVGASPDPTEILTVRRIPFDEALTMASDGRIADAMTLIALERAARSR
jgi:8-oxo-dGTP pyrophosphatase MutT (NUDIX family)